ncbi:MAG: YveK family protein [Christensenellales bacterium]
MTAKEMVKAILDRMLLVVLVPLVAVFAAAFISYNVIEPTYTAKTTMYVLNRQNAETLAYSDLTSGALLIADYKELAVSSRVIEATKKQTGLNDLKDFDIAVSAASNTRIIAITVQGKDPNLAANVANAIAENLSACIMEVMRVENINVIDAATPPQLPSGPDKIKNILLAGSIGLAFSIGLSLLLETSNTTIKTAEDIKNVLSLPVLAKIPNLDKRRKVANGSK